MSIALELYRLVVGGWFRIPDLAARLRMPERELIDILVAGAAIHEQIEASR